MSTLDWPALLLGMLLGLGISGLFFWGLSVGIRRALGAQHPAGTLLVSFLLRMTLLLGIGFALAALSASLWPLIGYVLAFFVVRWQVIRRARRAMTATV